MSLGDRLGDASRNLRVRLDPPAAVFEQVLAQRRRSQVLDRARLGVGLLAVVLAVAIPLVTLSRSSTTTVRSTNRGPTNGPASVAPVAPALLSGPACSTALATAPALGPASTTEVSAQGYPFGVQVSSDGHWAFVSAPGASAGLPSYVNVFSIQSGRPAFERSIPAPAGIQGEFLTRNGRYLLVATGTGAAVLDVKRAEAGTPGALLGVLGGGPQTGAWEVAASPDGRYAFVTYNDTGLGVTVFNLAKALTQGFGPSNVVGTVSTGGAEGVAISPNGKWLYATTTGDSLATVSIERAETDPRGAPVSSVGAGCGPNRVVVSPDGSTVWVSASGSDAVLGFSAQKLDSGDQNALIADVGVGALPVGMAIVDNGERLLVGDSNWTAYQPKPSSRPVPGGVSSLSVVSIPDALSGRPALIGTIPSGKWPRDVAYSGASHTFLVVNSVSGTLETVNVADLP